MNSFDGLGLRAELLDAVRAEGYTTPTPIQARTIPLILEGRDVLGGAQTGTGKTAAFMLPMLQLLSGREARGKEPRALVLTPTRELAAQVAESATTYGKGLARLRHAVVYGGVGMQPQIERLRGRVDILVATPGRLIDHAGRRTVDLSKVEILVLDEADRMLDMGFIHDIKRICAMLPPRRQNLFFSATYSDEIKSLADGILTDPVHIEVAPRNAAAELVEHIVHAVEREEKRALLCSLIRGGQWSQVLVFTRTKHGADKLTRQLAKEGVNAAAIHGNKSQQARMRALADFKAGKVLALVATDVAARGIDIESLPRVVNFDMPMVPEDYVHRIGRTGRAGASGQAFSFVSGDERSLLRGVERLLKTRLKVEGNADAAWPEGEAEPATQGRRAPRQGATHGRATRGAGRGEGRRANTRGDEGARPRFEQPRARHGRQAQNADGMRARNDEHKTRHGRPTRTTDGRAEVNRHRGAQEGASPKGATQMSSYRRPPVWTGGRSETRHAEGGQGRPRQTADGATPATPKGSFRRPAWAGGRNDERRAAGNAGRRDGAATAHGRPARRTGHGGPKRGS